MGKSLFSKMPTDKIGHFKKMLDLIFTKESFNCPEDTVHISTNPVQFWCSPCNSANDLISVLQVFTQLEDQHCK